MISGFGLGKTAASRDDFWAHRKQPSSTCCARRAFRPGLLSRSLAPGSARGARKGRCAATIPPSALGSCRLVGPSRQAARFGEYNKTRSRLAAPLAPHVLETCALPACWSNPRVQATARLACMRESALHDADRALSLEIVTQEGGLECSFQAIRRQGRNPWQSPQPPHPSNLANRSHGIRVLFANQGDSKNVDLAPSDRLYGEQ